MRCDGREWRDMLGKMFEKKEEELDSRMKDLKEEDEVKEEVKEEVKREVKEEVKLKEEVKSEVKVEMGESSEPSSPDIGRGRVPGIGRGRAKWNTADFEEYLTGHFSVGEIMSVMASERRAMLEEAEKLRKEMEEEQKRDREIVFGLLK